MFRKLTTILLIIFATNLLLSQNVNNEYIPKYKDSIKSYFERINKKQIKSISGPFSSKIKEVYKDRDKKNYKKLEDSLFLFNSDIQKHLSIVLNNIYKSNPEIEPLDFAFFIKNSPIANAACYGDGMFEINLGLFNDLESDDELAFVICHEIAHHLLKHSIRNVTNSVSNINSSETKKKVKKIKRSKYGRTRAALKIIDQLSTNILNYSKETEAEADSLGYALYSKTKYSKPKAISALNKLRRVDDMVLYHNIKLDSVFSFPNYPFKDYWMKEKTSLFQTDEVINEFALKSDTLKTHPEIGFRIEKLKNSNASINSEGKKAMYSSIKEIKKRSHLKSIEYTIHKKKLDLAIYLLIEKFEKNLINKEEYYTLMAKVLYEIYWAKKNHELGKYVQQKNSFSKEKQLNKIRLFLNNLELKEVKKIGFAFCQANKDNTNNNKDFNKIFTFFKNK